MIVSFGDEEVEKIFLRKQSRKFSAIQGIIYRKLLMLHAAARISDLRVPPGNRLEKLQGKIANRYSIRINSQWRICFLWLDGAREVTIEDYH